LNPDPIPYHKPQADKLRVVIMTHSFNLEGDLYFPRVGKEGRRFSSLLNTERRFMAMTNVSITNRVTGVKDPKPYPFIQVNMESVEFVLPFMDEREAERETQ
jgi:hypothetical protein